VLIVSTVSSTSCTGRHHLEDGSQQERSVGSVDTIVIIVSGCLSAVVLCVLTLAVFARLLCDSHDRRRITLSTLCAVSCRLWVCEILLISRLLIRLIVRNLSLFERHVRLQGRLGSALLGYRRESSAVT